MTVDQSMAIPVAAAVLLSGLVAHTFGLLAGLVLFTVSFVFGPVILNGVQLTLDFVRSLGASTKQGKIDGYNKQFSNETSTDDRNKDYASLVDSYYDLATEFYEWGWGTSFHFADRRKGETFRQSILRHEYYLAGRLGVKKGDTLLDCGCGVGGPARNIARFTGANVKAVTINQFQVDRGNTLSRRDGVYGQVESIQADFMKLPFEDNSFDGVYAIESTCHAPDRLGVYREIFRVMKPGTTFACYEWCLTDKFEAGNPKHEKIKLDIMLGDGLPDLVHTSVCTKALKDAGFDVLEVRDAVQDGHLEGGEPWFTPLTPSWNPFVWPRFQFNPVMFRIMPLLLRTAEFVGLVPAGTTKTQVMLQAGGIGCAQGGVTGTFTPAWLMVARKPLAQ
jgi:sterol 24-C-methyltransferase